MMKLETKNFQAKGFRISLHENGTEVGRAFIYLMHNDLHEQPFALLEDVYIDESFRGQGLGSDIIRQAIQLAKNADCYKLIATSRESRPKVHGSISI